ncbi:hypothetical protein GNI_160250 [Gregarina niphandrodes]|uniref:Uncharacterized protein n=1 Tax=Gregarina niphandrodes TaxID=110365 RepID=A0A023AZM8_GRENI|nr:hypothetical protein GNI_160250 [Gregarina niphandrodes]EZG43760.1 hypothetical protein GNI_160250 [Gregarina niphandrodes]|eukprot:XP_011134631.1 hypothetical protein GNI_160250 [Gregarina niphandrodes]
MDVEVTRRDLLDDDDDLCESSPSPVTTGSRVVPDDGSNNLDLDWLLQSNKPVQSEMVLEIPSGDVGNPVSPSSASPMGGASSRGGGSSGSGMLHDGFEEATDKETDRFGEIPRLKDYPESQTYRATPAMASCSLEAQEKVSIFILHNGECSVVSWFGDTAPQDVQQAVLCACDCMLDSGIELLELRRLRDDQQLKELREKGEARLGGQLLHVQYGPEMSWYLRGRRLEFEDFGHSLVNGQLYLLQPARQRDELSVITGHRYRRLLVEIPPLRHVEATRAPTLPEVFKPLAFGVVTKKGQEQLCAKSKHYGHLTHSCQKLTGYQGGPGLDCGLVDENEFDVWVTGLKALAAHLKGMRMNKMQLLSHSRRFRTMVERNDFQSRPDALPPVTTADLAMIVPQDLVTRAAAVQRYNSLSQMLEAMEGKVEEIDYPALATRGAGQTDRSAESATQSGSASPGFADELSRLFEEENDFQMEYKQMKHLLVTTRTLLQEVKHDLDAQLQRGEVTENVNGEPVIKVWARKLWIANVDIENIRDMYYRLTNDSPPISLHKAISDIQKQLEDGKDKLSKTWQQLLVGASSVVTPAVQKLKQMAEAAAQEQERATTPQMAKQPRNSFQEGSPQEGSPQGGNPPKRGNSPQRGDLPQKGDSPQRGDSVQGRGDPFRAGGVIAETYITDGQNIEHSGNEHALEEPPAPSPVPLDIITS